MKRFFSLFLVTLLVTLGTSAKYRSLSGQLSIKGTLNETFEEWPSGTAVTIQQLVDMPNDMGSYQRGLY